MRTLLNDARYGLRNLARTPGFTLVAMLTLALGIGANTTIFSVMNNTLLKPLAFPSPERLVLVWQTFGGRGPDNWNIVSAPNFWDFQKQSKSFTSIAILDSAGRGYNLGAAGATEAEQVSGLRVSAGFFDVLGVKPLMGRTFLPQEEMLGRDHEVILTYGLWQTRYAGDKAIIGKQIRMDGADFEVIGVMPREFQWQFWSGPRKLFVPVGYTKTDFGRGDHSFLSIARLKPGVTMAQANAELDGIAKGLAAAYPDDNTKMGGEVSLLGDYSMEGIRATMTALLAAVAFVLLIACVNVANLLLARGAARRKEFAVRRALGASGWRLGRQLLTEAMLLAVSGGVLGLILASLGTRVMFTVFQLDSLGLPMRPIDSIPMDGRVYAFALAISVITGLLFGVAPAWSVLRANVNEPLKEGGRGSSGRNRLRNVLVAAEVALALVVLTGAGLMIRSMTRLLSVDPGLNARNVLAMEMSVPQEIIYMGPPDLPRYCQDLDDHIGAVPGVVSVSAVGHLPFQGSAGRGFEIEGRAPAEPGNTPGSNYTVACPNYFRSMGIPVRKGREFTFQDSLHAPQVIVVNETLADAQALDDLLWTFNERSFVPHKICLDEHSLDPATPVQLTVDPSNVPAADLLVNMTARLPAHWELYPRVAEIIDADEDRRRLGRERFKSYRDLKVALETHQLDDNAEV